MATDTDLLVDPIKLDTGYVSGTMIGEPGKEVRIYRGIPYAAPPVGDLRWKPPQPAPSWSGIRECTRFSDSAAQAGGGFVRGRVSEDSLYLNVLTPAEKQTDRLPVMVWFHGGGFSIGSANQPPYHAPALAQHGVVLVGVNHRLGPIGLLAHPALSAESPNGVSGNYGFLDLIAALRWVQRSIAAFGGDPNRVTVFGESGGAGKSDLMMASPLAKGLFHRAICESGATTDEVGPRVLTLKEAEALGEKLAANLGVAGEGDVLAALRAIPHEEITKAAMALSRELRHSGPGGVGILDTVLVDGWFMPDTPDAIYKAGKHNSVPFIACANLGEVIAEKSFILMPKVINGYVIRLSAANKLGTKAFACMFTQVPSKWKEDGVQAFHGLEVMYVFGRLDALVGTPFAAGFATPSGATQLDPGLTEDDTQVSEAMMRMWVQFAATGDPSVQGLIDWPAWAPDTDQYLDIAWPLEVKSGLSKIAPQK